MPDLSSDLSGRLAFLRAAEALKDTLRSGFTAGGRPESTAEHTWRLLLWVEVLADLVPELDRLKLMRLALVHDLAEAVSGDIPAPNQHPDQDKSALERRDLALLTQALPSQQSQAIRDLWEEYEAAQTPEAVFIKGLDKLETLMQHTQGANPANFDYRFNLDYGRKATDRHPLIARLRQTLDAETLKAETLQAETLARAETSEQDSRQVS